MSKFLVITSESVIISNEHGIYEFVSQVTKRLNDLRFYLPNDEGLKTLSGHSVKGYVKQHEP